ncbi:MAG: glycosyltransferase family 2 protein [Butyrivibrio sp.]|nr:glycosyltransferase family 2 protein [Butyrivibrio sp.]
MFFSIIVPVHNGAEYLESSVKSALEQNQGFYHGEDPLYEIVIVENGSSDSTPQIADELAKNSPVRVVHKKAIGLYSARQAGIEAAKGEWIVALDSDDSLRPDALSKLYSAICKYREAGTEPDLIIYDAAGMRSAQKKLFKRSFTPDRVCTGEDIRIFKEKLCMDDSINSMWTKCISRRIAYLGNQELYLNYGEDLYQTAEYLDRAKAVVYFDEILYYYREGAVSLSSTYSELYLDNQKITWGKLDEMVNKWELFEYTDIINRRKALTCTIAVTKLIYSNMLIGQKKYKLSKLLSDEFYRTYHSYELPDWAPEESAFVRKLQIADDKGSALLINGTARSIKNWVKRRLRKGSD